MTADCSSSEAADSSGTESKARASLSTSASLLAQRVVQSPPRLRLRVMVLVERDTPGPGIGTAQQHLERRRQPRRVVGGIARGGQFRGGTVQRLDRESFLGTHVGKAPVVGGEPVQPSSPQAVTVGGSSR